MNKRKCSIISEYVNDIDRAVSKAKIKVVDSLSDVVKKQHLLEQNDCMIQEGFFDLFKKKTKETANTVTDITTDTAEENIETAKVDVFLEKVLAEIEKITTINCVNFEHEIVNSVSINDSYCGGKPTYLPKGFITPKNGSDDVINFLAQINCKQLSSLPGFPHTGILQFWVNMDDEDDSKVYYYENTSNGMSESEIDEICSSFDYTDWCIDKGTIVKLTPSEDTEFISMNNVYYTDLFVDTYNTLAEQEGIDKININDVFDLDEKVWDTPFGKFNHFKTKCGGYPEFTQSDTRAKKNNMTVLLFQLNSGKGVMWGDMGIGNFFITEDNLKAKNFNNVMFHWDCC